MIDRAAINTALAKCLAYKAAGKDDKAAEWASRLIALLRQADIQFE